MAGGRPAKKIDWEELDRLCGLRLSEDDILDILKTTWDTINKNTQKFFALSFSDYRVKKMSKTKARLAEKAIEMALRGNVPMLIFCLKNFNNWSDRSEITLDRLPEPFIIKRSDGSEEILGSKAGAGGKILPIKGDKK